MFGLLGNKNVIIVIILAVLVSAVGGYIAVLRSKVETLTEKNKALDIELSVSKASVVTLRASIDEQNAAVEQMKTAADNRTLAFLDELAKAKETSTNYRNQAALLLKKTSPQNMSKCDAANQLINEGLIR